MLNPATLEALKNNQRQLDMDGCEVGVSRQALDELIAAYESLATVTPAEVGGHADTQTEARAIAPPATRPFVGRLIRIFTERPGDDTSAVVLIEYAQAALATALAAKDAELAVQREAKEHARRLCDRAEAQLAEARKALDGMRDLIRWAHDTLYEINPSNYDHDEVCKLNSASVEVILALAPPLGETHGKSAEWWEGYAARRALTGGQEDGQ